MTNPIDKAQPEALRLADELDEEAGLIKELRRAREKFLARLMPIPASDPQ